LRGGGWGIYTMMRSSCPRLRLRLSGLSSCAEMGGLPRLEVKRRCSAGRCKNGEMGFGGNDPSNWDGEREGVGGGWRKSGCRRPPAVGGCLAESGAGARQRRPPGAWRNSLAPSTSLTQSTVPFTVPLCFATRIAFNQILNTYFWRDLIGVSILGDQQD
jgi:hypothetical protein